MLKCTTSLAALSSVDYKAAIPTVALSDDNLRASRKGREPGGQPRLISNLPVATDGQATHRPNIFDFNGAISAEQIVRDLNFRKGRDSSGNKNPDMSVVEKLRILYSHILDFLSCFIRLKVDPRARAGSPCILED